MPLFLQPRAPEPGRLAAAARRARFLADLLAGTATVIVEDDHANDISAADLVSISHQSCIWEYKSRDFARMRAQSAKQSPRWERQASTRNPSLFATASCVSRTSAFLRVKLRDQAVT